MLGKICTACLLVVASACLVRSQPASKEKLAGIADDVAALLSKLGAKSTDEAVSKMWAKGDDLTEADYEDLGKLLQSSDGAAALAAIQRPVTAKLARVSSILDEYNRGLRMPEEIRKGMLADLDKTIDELNVAVDKLNIIRSNVSRETAHFIPRIEYPARKILEMDKIVGLARIKRLMLVGTPDDVVQANLLVRNFEDLAYFMESNSRNKYSLGKLLAFKKTMTEGNLEDEVLPIFRSLLYNRVYNISLTELVSYRLARAADGEWHYQTAFIRSDLGDLLDSLLAQARLFDEIGISAVRRKEIELGTLRLLKGAGKDGSETLEKIGISGWAKSIRAEFNKEVDQIVGVSPNGKNAKIINQRLQEIENM